jgi:hypothetical protein
MGIQENPTLENPQAPPQTFCNLCKELKMKQVLPQAPQVFQGYLATFEGHISHIFTLKI